MSEKFNFIDENFWWRCRKVFPSGWKFGPAASYLAVAKSHRVLYQCRYGGIKIFSLGRIVKFSPGSPPPTPTPLQNLLNRYLHTFIVIMQLRFKCGGKWWNQPLKITKWGHFKDSTWSRHKIETFGGDRDFFGPLNGTSDSHFGAIKVEGPSESRDLFIILHYLILIKVV